MVSKYFSMKGDKTRTPQSFAQLDSETLRRSMKHEKILSDHRTGHSAERVLTYATKPNSRDKRESERVQPSYMHARMCPLMRLQGVASLLLKHLTSKISFASPGFHWKTIT